MSTTAPSANPFSSPATLSGKIHGGNQPVIGAAVNLWFAGQGVPATKAAITTTDSLGSFSFTKDAGGNGTTNIYTCPASGGSPLVYVTSQGGNTQNNGVPGQTNTAAAFIALYGECSGLGASNFVYMSEVTTVATMVAVQQLFNPAADSQHRHPQGRQYWRRAAHHAQYTQHHRVSGQSWRPASLSPPPRFQRRAAAILLRP